MQLLCFQRDMANYSTGEIPTRALRRRKQHAKPDNLGHDSDYGLRIIHGVILSRVGHRDRCPRSGLYREHGSYAMLAVVSLKHVT